MTAKIRVFNNLDTHELAWWYRRVTELSGQPFEFVFVDPIICDGCGEQFKTTLDEDDDPMPLGEEAEEFGWTVNEGSVYYGNCQHLDPDQAQGFDLDYSRRIL